MKRFLSTWISGVTVFSLLFTACGTDEQEKSSTKGVDLVKGVNFSISFSDYDDSTAVEGETRSRKNEQAKTIIPMGKLFAEVVIQRNAPKAVSEESTEQTRSLTDGTYTICAYQGGVLKGTLKGVVSSNVFTATSPNQDIVLEPGTYTFVCCNDKVNATGSTWTISRENAGTALIGINKDIEVKTTPRRQDIKFEMKHVGCQINMEIKTEDYPTENLKATLISTVPLPQVATFSPATLSFSYSHPAAFSKEIGGNKNEILYFFPGINGANFKLTLNSGKAYKLPVAGRNVTFPALTTTKINGYYGLNYILKYNYIYLYSDGSIGQFTDPTHTSKTPIAVVVSRKKKLAVALNQASYTYNGAYWHRGYGSEDNSFMSETYSDHLNDFHGEDYTWNPAYSKDGTTIKANDQNYNAFYQAAHYNPGVMITGANVGKWFLPTIGELNLLNRNLNFADTDFGFEDASKYLYTPVNYAFYRVNGTEFAKTNGNSWTDYTNYISSSEHSSMKCYVWQGLQYQDLFMMMQLINEWRGVSTAFKDGPGSKGYYIRPFIHYS